MQMHFLKCDKKALYRAFLFFISIVATLGISSSFLWSVQSPLLTSFNNEVVSFLFFIFYFLFFIRRRTAFVTDEITTVVVVSVVLTLPSLFYKQNGTGALIYCLYTLNFLLLYSITINLNVSNFKVAMNTVFFAIFLTSVICVFITIFQWLGFANKGAYFSDWIYPATSARFSANLAQPNNLATLFVVGIISANYFFKKEKYYIFLLGFILLFVFCIVLTGSRTSYVSLFFVFIASVFLSIRNKKLIAINFSSFLYFLILSGTYDNWMLISPLDFQMERARGVDSGRYLIWQMALDAISEKPFFGYGAGNIVYAFKQVLPYNLNFLEESVPASAHNIILDYAICFGVPFVIFSLYFILIALFKCLRNVEYTNKYCFIACIPVVVHSFLEYPQNYGYFLFPMAIFFGGAMRGTQPRRGDAWLFKGVFLCVAALSFFAINNYYEIEKNFKKLRLQKNGVSLNNEFKGSDSCFLRSYCDFLDIHLLKDIENINDLSVEVLSNVIATPFTVEVSIFSKINRKDYFGAGNEILNYCLFFGAKECSYLEKRLKLNFSNWKEFIPGEILKITLPSDLMDDFN